MAFKVATLEARCDKSKPAMADPLLDVSRNILTLRESLTQYVFIVITLLINSSYPVAEWGETKKLERCFVHLTSF